MAKTKAAPPSDHSTESTCPAKIHGIQSAQIANTVQLGIRRYLMSEIDAIASRAVNAAAMTHRAISIAMRLPGSIGLAPLHALRHFEILRGARIIFPLRLHGLRQQVLRFRVVAP